MIVKDVELDWGKVHERREAVRKSLTGGVAGLFKNNGIDLIQGEATLTEDGNVKVGDDVHETKNVVLATGLGRAADPRRGVRRPGPRHLGRLVAGRSCRRAWRWSARARRARRSPPPTPASGPR